MHKNYMGFATFEFKQFDIYTGRVENSLSYTSRIGF